jgi:predicted solute-binding protein
VGGTEKYTRMLGELFYKLKNHPGAFASWLASFLNEDDTGRSADDAVEQRATLEEPDDTSGLL